MSRIPLALAVLSALACTGGATDPSAGAPHGAVAPAADRKATELLEAKLITVDTTWNNGDTVLNLDRMRYDGNHVELTIGVIGSDARSFPVAMGVSIWDEDGVRHDLEPKLVTEAGPEVFAGDVGPDAIGAVVGVWSEARPCSTGSEGCERWGVELDGQIAQLPPSAYWSWGDTPETFWKPSGPRSVQVIEAGGGPGAAAEVLAAAKPIAELWEQPFDTGLTVDTGPAAKNPRKGVQVMYRPDGRELGERLWLQMSADHPSWNVQYNPWDEAPADVVIAVGPPEAR